MNAAETEKALRELRDWLLHECAWPANAEKYADRWTEALESAMATMKWG